MKENLVSLVRKEHKIEKPHVPDIEDGKTIHSMKLPCNSMKLTTYICCDARKEECPYYVRIIIDTPYLSFDQNICGYNFRKRE
jgi:hypothetical protein